MWRRENLICQKKLFMREILWCLGLRGGRCNPGVAPHEGGLILREHLNLPFSKFLKVFAKSSKMNSVMVFCKCLLKKLLEKEDLEEVWLVTKGACHNFKSRIIPLQRFSFWIKEYSKDLDVIGLNQNSVFVIVWNPEGLRCHNSLLYIENWTTLYWKCLFVKMHRHNPFLKWPRF